MSHLTPSSPILQYFIHQLQIGLLHNIYNNRITPKGFFKVSELSSDITTLSAGPEGVVISGFYCISGNLPPEEGSHIPLMQEDSYKTFGYRNELKIL